MMDIQSYQHTLRKPRRLGRILAMLLALTVLVLLVVWFKVVRAGGAPHMRRATFVTKQGPLNISVIESGTIKSQEKIIIKNEVEGRTSIISLIPEGTFVKEGDLLVELDASRLKDTKIDHEIRVQNAQAALVNASENMIVLQNQSISDVNVAELTLRFARQDLIQYRTGEFPNLETAAENAIHLAEEELTRAQNTLTWSEKLYNEKYISETELQADRLAVTRNKNRQTLAENDRMLLKRFTYIRNIKQLESDVDQAELALIRVQHRAKAEGLQAEAELRARELQYKRAQDLLKKIEDQLTKTQIRAPRAGMVIHATSAQSGGAGDGSRQPLDEGQEVHERQELIHLPTTDAYIAAIHIHAVNVEKVSVGLPVSITVHALPGMTFTGSLAKVAPLPDPHFVHMNPDLKVYGAEVHLSDHHASLHTGMSCKCEVIVAQYEQAVYVPVQAVKRVNGEAIVHVMAETGEIERRIVQAGLDDNRMIHITSGLTPGEVVLLVAPEKSREQEGEEDGDSGANSEAMDAFDRRVEALLAEDPENTDTDGVAD
jgi:HlyD family secretion protein